MKRSRLRSLFFWAVLLPLGLSGIPTAIWATWGWLFATFDQPGQSMSVWAVGGMMVLFTSGIIALAVLPFVRGGFATEELKSVFPEGPKEWRNLCLFLGLMCLTLFDVLACLGSAIPGGDKLWIGAAPFYLIYLLLVRLVLLGRPMR